MFFTTPVPGQRFLAPEVVQTSAMDCGPAALKSILEGFNIPVSYGRLREACQTDVDGTSINTIEDLAVQLGLRAEQIMIPLDHLLLPEAQALPAIVVIHLPTGLTHFLVVWGQVGKYLQVMDPATGRRWPTWEKFQEELYIHSYQVAAADWRAWSGTQGFIGPLRRRLVDLRIEADQSEKLIESATEDPGWRSLATLDAATRMVASIVRSKGLVPGEQAANVLERFYALGLKTPIPDIDLKSPNEISASPAGDGLQIPAIYWSVLPAKEEAEETPPEEEVDQLILRGAVLVRILGPREEVEIDPETGQLTVEITSPLPPDLEAALKEPSYRPEKEILKTLREDGLLTPTVVAFALFLATLTVMIEALLLQGVILIGGKLGSISQRIWAAIILMVFVLAPLLLDFPVSSAILRMGRRLETRLRIALLEKIPRLGDRYFRSRLTSDMTQRVHDLRQLRSLPSLGFGLLKTGFQLILTTLGVIWLDPISAPFAIGGTIVFIALSFLSQPILEERDLKMRTHIGALSRFYLDALLGLVPIKSHSAERAMRRQYESRLVEWTRSGWEYFNTANYVQSLGTVLYSIFSILIVMNYIAKGGQASEILLLFYWTLRLPTLGQEFAFQIQQYPMLRNRVLRLLEPMGAPDEETTWVTDKGERGIKDDSEEQDKKSVSIVMENVVVQAGGHKILKGIDLDIKAGEHVAVIGLSGAGKSSLVGLLLGWHRPSSGRILVDGEILDGELVQKLRLETAWVDPAVQLWNRSFYDNLRYGMEYVETPTVGAIIQKADLFDVLERLPEGLRTTLGEGGGLVSGGEGQRVRLGRAMLRPDVRLVILDEPFRGLDRPKRTQLLAETRDLWQYATLFCITHDVSETMTFPRVLVIEDGRIIEDAPPQQLASQPDSRYRSLLESEEEVRKMLWESTEWRRLVMEDGHARPEALNEDEAG